MQEPESYHFFKKNRSLHKYEKTHECHQQCLAYEKFLESKKEKLDVTYKEVSLKITKANGVIVSIKTEPAISTQELISVLKHFENRI